MQLLNRLWRRNDSTANPSASETITTDNIYSLLQNKRRRRAIEYLATHEKDVVSLRETADHLAEEMDDDRQTTYISLLQQHAPQMDKAGIVTHDSQAQELHVNKSLKTVYRAHRVVKESL